MDKKLRIIIWILVGSCVLNLVFALNAGQKRKIALSDADGLGNRLKETELRYKNAIQAYDAVEKDLQEAKKDLEQQNNFSDTLKETLSNEQKKSAALEQELKALKAGSKPVSKPLVKNIEDKPQKKSAPVSNVISKAKR